MRALILLLALSGCDDPPNAPMEVGSVNQYRDEAHRVTCYTVALYGQTAGRSISCVADPTPCPVCADGGAR